MASDRDALRNKKKETPGGGVSLYDEDTTLVLQGGATFTGKVTAWYLLFFLFYTPALVGFSQSLRRPAAVSGNGAKSSPSELPLWRM